MTTEELLKPRYKVIADYPGMKGEGLEVGQIITCRNYDNDFSEKLWCEMNNKYPHLFQYLMWWEFREIEDLPEYLKLCLPNDHEENGLVFKVDKYEEYYVDDADIPHDSYLAYSPEIRDCVGMIFCEPATQEEYDNQNTKK